MHVTCIPFVPPDQPTKVAASLSESTGAVSAAGAPPSGSCAAEARSWTFRRSTSASRYRCCFQKESEAMYSIVQPYSLENSS